MNDLEEYAKLCEEQSKIRQVIRMNILKLQEIDTKLKNMDRAVFQSTKTNTGNYPQK